MKKSTYNPKYYTPEAKKERFKRVVERRTNKIMEKLSVLSNCSNKNLYIYTQVEVDKVFNYLEKKLVETKAKFTKNKTIFRI